MGICTCTCIALRSVRGWISRTMLEPRGFGWRRRASYKYTGALVFVHYSRPCTPRGVCWQWQLTLCGGLPTHTYLINSLYVLTYTPCIDPGKGWQWSLIAAPARVQSEMSSRVLHFLSITASCYLGEGCECDNDRLQTRARWHNNPTCHVLRARHFLRGNCL